MGNPKLQNLNKKLEKKLCFTKNAQMGDLISLNFFRAVPGLGWLVRFKSLICSDKMGHLVCLNFVLILFEFQPNF